MRIKHAEKVGRKMKISTFAPKINAAQKKMRQMFNQKRALEL